MRAAIAAVLALLFMAAPAAAQSGEAAQVNGQLTEAGRWFEQLGQALAIGSEGLEEINQGMQQLMASPPSRERAAAAVPELRKRIERGRADVRRSNAMLDALPAFPQAMVTEIPPRQLLADARAFNARMLGLLDTYDDFLVAMGKSDKAAMERVLPKLMEGAFAMIGQQRLVLRNRQATMPTTESNYQALGVAGQIYRAMEAVFRHSTAARGGAPADAARAAAELGKELRLIADETRALAIAGRRNVAREVAEIDASRGRADAAEARLMERVRRVFAAESRTFEIADRLVAFAEANKNIAPAQLRAGGRSPLFPPLQQLERDYMAIAMEQAALLAEGK